MRSNAARSPSAPDGASPKPARISVALCTYNGARHIGDQLRSIAAQSVPPAEVVVCDDRSADDTVQMVERWASEVPFPVYLSVNETNLGSSPNFGRALGLCTGDIIALADQDDIWLPDKLQRQRDALTSNPAAGLAFTDLQVVDENLSPVGYRFWESVRFRGAEQRMVREGRAVDVLLRRNVVTGAAMAFRSEFRDLILPVPANLVHVHDGWIAFLIAAVAPIVPIPEPSVLYRQHGSNLIGAHRPTGPGMLARAAAASSRDRNLADFGATIEWYEQLRQRLRSHEARFSVPPRVYALIDGRIAHDRWRSRLPDSRMSRVPPVAVDLLRGRYHRYSKGIWDAARDLIA